MTERGLVCWFAIGLLLLAACNIEDSRSMIKVSANRQAIVYGEDDRVDVLEAGVPFAALARESAVALIAADKLVPLENGDYAISAPSYGQLQRLCPGERFSTQPAAANCSGVMIAPDVVATAGHCLSVAADGSPDCSQSRYVFGYAITESTTDVVISASNVRECARVLIHLKPPSDSACRYDVALVELKPSAESIATAASVRNSAVVDGEHLTVIGSTAGLPQKVDSGARVVDARHVRGDYFTLSSDTFFVSSGSGVFDVNGKLVGLFARGRRDYDVRELGGGGATCQSVHTEPEYGALAYEEATHIAVVERLRSSVSPGQSSMWPSEVTCDPLMFLKDNDHGESIAPSASSKPDTPTGCALVHPGGRNGDTAGATGWAWSLCGGLLFWRRRRSRRCARQRH